jgi:hypothetical protein
MTTRPLWKKPAYGLMRSMPKTIEAQLSRANCMHSDAASQGGGWWQGCGAAYIIGMMRRIELLSRLTATGELAKNHIRLSSVNDQTVRTV